MSRLRFSKKIMDAKTALNEVSEVIGPVELAHAQELTFYMVAVGTITAGAVQIETSHDKAYTGTWNPEGAAVTLVTNSVKRVSLTGAYLAARARISTGLTGGASLDVHAVVN